LEQQFAGFATPASTAGSMHIHSLIAGKPVPMSWENENEEGQFGAQKRVHQTRSANW